MERVEERLFALRAAARKYNVAADDLAALAERFAGDVAAIDAGEAELATLEAAQGVAEAAYAAAAQTLSAGRRKAAKKLDAAVQAELPPLKLERARFITEIVTDPESRDAAGIDRVEFWAQTNPGTKPGPMMRVASGGELSRFMLALKVVLADKGSAPTLIFDEIDTGVGGAVADAIGLRLARLAQTVQVVAVTHAPRSPPGRDPPPDRQGAGEGGGAGRDPRLDAPVEDRREEIARMLAGATVTDEARAAAARLLQGA